jgi:cold shock CspA family protein
MHSNFCTETSTQVCGSRALGRVKSYSAAHGYGFLVCSNLEEDIFFSEESVPIDDLRHLRNGSGVTFTLSKCPQKRRLRANSLNLTFSGVVRWHHRAYMYAFITCVDSLVEGDVSFSHSDLVNKIDVILPGSVARFQLYWNISSGRFRARQVKLSGFPADRPTLEDHVSDSAVKCGHIDQVLTPADGACKKPGEQALLAPSSAETTQLGIVKSFNAARGYGFVQVSGMSQDVWFAAACVGGEPVTVGMHVQTEVYMIEDGKYRANWVRSCDLY